MHCNRVILGGHVLATQRVKLSAGGQPIKWVLVIGNPPGGGNAWRDPFSEWVMTIGKTALVMERHARQGRSLLVQGVISKMPARKAPPIVCPHCGSNIHTRLPETSYVKALEAAFGDAVTIDPHPLPPIPGDQLSQLREEESPSQDDPPTDQETPPNLDYPL